MPLTPRPYPGPSLSPLTGLSNFAAPSIASDAARVGKFSTICTVLVKNLRPSLSIGAEKLIIPPGVSLA